MNKQVPILILMICTLLAACGCGRRSGTQSSIHPSSTPDRIVSLTPSNTEILFALRLGDRVVGVTSQCNYPPQARKIAKTGDVNTSTEKVIALKPDLVLAHGYLNDATVKKLKTLGVRVLVSDPKTFEDVLQEIERIGAITDTGEAARKLVQSMRDKAAKVKADASKGRSKRVLVVVQTTPLWVAGPETFVDEMIEFANGENVAHDARPGFNQFSSEKAFARDPEIILVTRKEDKAFFEESLIWRKTTAVRNGNIVVIHPDLIFRPGPRLTQGLERLAAALSEVRD